MYQTKAFAYLVNTLQANKKYKDPNLFPKNNLDLRKSNIFIIISKEPKILK